MNGLLAHSDETDDSHGPSQSHPGASIVPAALALGEDIDISGQHYLRAVTLGYDIGPRLTMALGGPSFRDETRRSTHAFAGTFGSAAAAGCVAGLSPGADAVAARLRLATGGGYAIWGRDTDHIEKGFVFGGMPARNGVTAALLVRAGWNGVDDVFSVKTISSRERAQGQSVAARRGSRERYEIINTDIKKWTVGTPIQAPLDAIENIRKKRPFEADEVKEVVVRLAPSVGSVVDNRDIPDICLQHMIAVMLIDKTRRPCRTRQATDAGRDGPSTTEESGACAMPHWRRFCQREWSVEVTLNDGMQLSDRVEAVRGTVRNPMSRNEVVDTRET